MTPSLALSLGIRHALIISTGTWPGSIFDSLVRLLEASGIMMSSAFHESSNVRDVDVEMVYDVFVRQSCDGLISLGGGSAHDTAKAVRVLAASGRRTIRGSYGRRCTKGISTVPHVAINTTSGTGAEVSSSYVYTDTSFIRSPRKRFVIDELVVPTVAIDDPVLMLSQPSWLVAYSGVDALTHAIEACAARPNILAAKELAFGAAGDIATYLLRAVNNPGDQDIMSRLCAAQLMAGVAFSAAGLGLAHAVSHALSARFDIHHGLANAVALPHVLKYNMYFAQESYAQMMGVVSSGAGGDEARDPEMLVGWIESLFRTLKMPRTVGEIPDVRLEDSARVGVVRELVDHIMEDPCIETNPRPVYFGADIEDLVMSVLGHDPGL